MGKPISGAFIRKSFYIDPPHKRASVEEWEAWLKADRQEAINAKRAHTKAQAHVEIPDYLQPTIVAKVGGVYRQSAMVGFVGDGDSSRLEAAVDADQDRTIAIARMQADHTKRGSVSRAKNERHQSNKKAKARQARAQRFNKGRN
jgi:hypothetical protein